ncbi:interleukin-12 subunit beta [Echeneis naucrates]|uniref:Interleukin-12 subunit beta n=1 Tax=Echeneis naucrates TaxID=173247 RepID=A0A665U579_ECHNA|nr:interleukin-12 subunit beta-like [Echeneis naucrates]
MSTLFLTVLCAVLCCAYSDSHEENIETLMDNVLVLKVPYDLGSQQYVPLTCGEAYQNQPVFWKKDGMELNPPLQGNQVRVLVEEMRGGNFTCHLGPDGEYLNHTLILVQLDPDNRTVILEERSTEEGHIHCSAPNYKGAFDCTWTRSQSRSNAVVLLVKAERNLEKIACELNADGSGVHCEDISCPYKEEQYRISLTIYIHSYSRLEAYTKAFYLSEIVRPAKLSKLQISEGTVFTWNYPDSWETPGSFFGLEFQVKIVSLHNSCNSRDHIQNDITEKTSYEVTIKPKRYVFCVQARDKYTKGPWSPWSHCTVDKKQVTC